MKNQLTEGGIRPGYWPVVMGIRGREEQTMNDNGESSATFLDREKLRRHACRAAVGRVISIPVAIAGAWL